MPSAGVLLPSPEEDIQVGLPWEVGVGDSSLCLELSLQEVVLGRPPPASTEQKA